MSGTTRAVTAPTGCGPSARPAETIILIGSRIAVTIQTTKDRRAIRAVRGRGEDACQAALLRIWRLRKAEGRAVQGGDRELLKASTEKFLWMGSQRTHRRTPASGRGCDKEEGKVSRTAGRCRRHK
jgi:hypothetical protein